METHARQIEANEILSEANMHKLTELDIRVEQAQHAAADAVDNQDRLDRALRTQTDMVQSLSKTEQMERMRLKLQREQDMELLNTVNITGFNPEMIRGRGSNQAARGVLSTIGCEDLISAVKSIKISPRSVKLTFPDRAECETYIP